jgi:LEA14-like dessication related protein
MTGTLPRDWLVDRRARRTRRMGGMVRQRRRRNIPGAASRNRQRSAFLLLLLSLLGACVSRPAVDVNLIGLTPMESTLFEQRLRMDFRLQNFSQEVIRATGFHVTLEVNGRRLARGVDDSSILLTGLSETTASAVVSTSLFAVARQLLELSSRDSFDYRLSGRLFLDGWSRGVPFARSGEISREELQRLVGAGGNEPEALTL